MGFQDPKAPGGGLPPPPPPAPDQPAGADRDKAAQKQQQQLLEYLQKRGDATIAALSSAQKTMLGGMTVTPVANAAQPDVYTVRDGGKPVATIYKSGVSFDFKEHATKPEDIQANIENTFKSGMIFKASFGKETTINGESEMKRAMQVKAAELLGIKVLNPPPADKTLDKLNPELARQMEKWADDHNARAPKQDAGVKADEKYNAESATNSRNGVDPKDTSALVKEKSSLDTIQKGTLTKNFGPAADPSLQVAVNTPTVAPVVPGTTVNADTFKMA
jgi:hypothetical protein